MSRNTLTDLERGDEDCILRFADGAAFWVSYLSIRCRCQCAKCKPRQENEQRQLELAMALATRPKLLLLDEPMAGMGVEEPDGVKGEPLVAHSSKTWVPPMASVVIR